MKLKDIHKLNQLKNLKELHVSSLEYEFNDRLQMNSEMILEKVIELEGILRNCKFYVDHHLYH